MHRRATNPLGRTDHGRCVKSAGFTLVELLVVIMIIGLLLALLLPAVQMARESGRRMQCVNHLKQIGVAIHNYENTCKSFPPSCTRRPDHNMLTFLLPFLEDRPTYDKYDWSKDWDHADNRPVTEVNMTLFVCPTAPGARQFISDYATCETIGPRNIMVAKGICRDRKSWDNIFRPRRKRSTRMRDVTDGLSNSFMLFEDSGRPHLWVKGKRQDRHDLEGAAWADSEAPFYIDDRDCVLQGEQTFNCTNNNEIYSFHPTGANFLYGDGSVRFQIESIDPETFVSLFTMAAGDNSF